MRSDGHVLPDLIETTVLHQLGLVRSDELPDIAGRWLAADVVDTESVRMLAGHDAYEPWALERLLADSVSEARMTVPATTDEQQRIAMDWVTMRWCDSRDTRWAVGTLAEFGETHFDFDLGLFVGM